MPTGDSDRLFELKHQQEVQYLSDRGTQHPVWQEIKKKEGKKALTFVEKMKKLIHAGISTSVAPNRLSNDMDDLPTLEERIRKALGIIYRPDRPATNMLFFVMYDIGSNKVRTLVAKYLLRNGCTRIQRSIFLADLPSADYERIRNDLTAVQAA